jgi:hypothetical protein
MAGNASASTITVHVPLTFSSRGGCKIILTDAIPPRQYRTDNALLKALAQAFRWRKRIESGEFASITELARSQGVNDSYACRLLRLTLLAPSTVTCILNGEHKPNLTLKELSKPFPIVWNEQFSARDNDARHKLHCGIFENF